MKQSKKTALAGILTALCVAFLFIGSLVQMLDLSAAAMGSIVVLVAFIELGKAWSFGVYVAATVLSLLLLPYKTPAAVFACFAGFYPILKEPLNRIQPKILSYAARIGCFNVFLTALIFIATKLLHIEEDYLAFGVVIYALSNVVFVAYDMALEQLSVFYISKIRPKLFERR